jgi:hypothetical protein
MAVTTDMKMEPVSTQPEVCIFHWSIPLDCDSEMLKYGSSKGTAPMKAGGNKNALNRELGADGQRDWSFGLFDCFDTLGLCMCCTQHSLINLSVC